MDDKKRTEQNKKRNPDDQEAEYEKEDVLRVDHIGPEAEMTH
jgi:hypothetical protein